MMLPRYTWDQAEILRLWPPASFAAVGIQPATVRKWASRGLIKAAGQGPNGCRLYPYDSVVARAIDRYVYVDSWNPDSESGDEVPLRFIHQRSCTGPGPDGWCPCGIRSCTCPDPFDDLDIRCPIHGSRTPGSGLSDTPVPG